MNYYDRSIFSMPGSLGLGFQHVETWRILLHRETWCNGYVASLQRCYVLREQQFVFEAAPLATASHLYRNTPFPEGPAIEKIQSRSKIPIPARNFQSRSKFSISIENFNPRVSIYGALVVYREGLDRKCQSTIDRSKFSIPKAAIEFIQSPGPLGLHPQIIARETAPSGSHCCKVSGLPRQKGRPCCSTSLASS